MKAAVAWLQEDPAVAPISDADEVARRYRRLRLEVLLGSMVAYGMFYFCRKNLSAALPLLSRDLGYTNAQLGILGSVLYITYGVSKFLTGLVADRASARRILIIGLLLSAGANVVFGLSSSLMILAVVWGLNGVFQATGAPACAKLLANWFAPSERGTSTGIWNISHQGGGGLVIILAGSMAAAYGWRGAMIGPAIVTTVVGLLVVWFLHDRPEALGLPPIEKHRNESVPAEEELATVPLRRLVIDRVLTSPRVWLVALASGCTYIVRYGVLDWCTKYLVEVRGLPIETAALQTSLLEFVGIPGALLCGWLSDKVFRARRAPVAAGSLALLGLCTWLLYQVPAGNRAFDLVLISAIGFFTYGPQLLLAGVAPVDMTSKRVAATAVGFTGLVSYGGSVVSSIVTGHLIDSSGWGSAFSFWAGAAVVGALLCLPLWRVRAGQTTG